MCGLGGIVLPQTGSAAALAEVAARMADTLRHRGPDDGGTWVDLESGVALGHRRLAIVDLFIEGYQPMVTPSGFVTFEGEIHNFKQLRQELKRQGQSFRGPSDTEVLLASIDQWGLDAALSRLVRMFAFALWDRRLRSIHLVRDRLGKSPLYSARWGRISGSGCSGAGRRTPHE
jgi:asparagine synthase (glutamine-hydrolysing)